MRSLQRHAYKINHGQKKTTRNFLQVAGFAGNTDQYYQHLERTQVFIPTE